MKKHLLTTFIAVAVLSSVLTGCSEVPKSAETATNDQAANSTNNTAAPFAGDDQSTTAPKVEKKSLFGGSTSEAPTTLTVPAGTVLAVRLQSTVSSATSQPGDSFDATLDEPLIVKGETIAPKGAAVIGRVVEAKSSGRLHDSGYLRLTLAAITINGKEVPVQSSSLSAKGANHNKRNATLIGGGAGAGALIGAIAGGGKGALIGGLVGAGAGTGGAYATGKKDVAFGAERRLSFRLTQAFTTKV